VGKGREEQAQCYWNYLKRTGGQMSKYFAQFKTDFYSEMSVCSELIEGIVPPTPPAIPTLGQGIAQVAPIFIHLAIVAFQNREITRNSDNLIL